MAEKFFTINFPVGTRDTDNFGFCRPSSLQSFMQEAATQHSLSFGASREELNDSIGVIWILMRSRVDLVKPIRYPSVITATTWTAPISGARFIREFKIESDGEEVGYASSLWVIADAKTHRIVRPAEAMKVVNFTPADSALYPEPGKLTPLQPLTAQPSFSVRYSDLDINNHVNNARYVDYACNAVHLEKMDGKFLSAMQVNFSSEYLSGDEVRIYTGKNGDQHYILGTDTDEKKHFEAFLEFKPL